MQPLPTLNFHSLFSLFLLGLAHQVIDFSSDMESSGDNSIGSSVWEFVAQHRSRDRRLSSMSAEQSEQFNTEPEISITPKMSTKSEADPIGGLRPSQDSILERRRHHPLHLSRTSTRRLIKGTPTSMRTAGFAPTLIISTESVAIGLGIRPKIDLSASLSH